MIENSQPPFLMAVTGPVHPGDAGVTDAHNHVWIEPVPGAVAAGPVLNIEELITAELLDYRNSGGGTIVDCQPGGCGRNGRKLQKLAESTGVNLVASTGYHLQKYYPNEFWLFGAPPEAAQQVFVDELTRGLLETQENPSPVLAGFIKIACEDTFDKSPIHLMQAAVAASRDTGAAIAVHTEKGSDVERIVNALLGFGLPAGRLVLCHMDKRPDFGLHQALAQEGILLEYDTFYRPKYRPDRNVWPLLESMVAANLASSVAIATDMAEAHLWKRFGGGPGLAGIFEQVFPKLLSFGFDPVVINQLTGQNINERLSRP